MRSKILIKFAVIIAEFYYCRKCSKCKNELSSMQANYSNCKDFIIAEFHYCRKHPKCKNKLPSIPGKQRLIEIFIIASALIKKMQKQTTLLALISQGFERCFIFVAFPPFINKGTLIVPYLKEGGGKNYQYQNIGEIKFIRDKNAE